MGDEPVPDKQHDHRTDRSADEAGTRIEPVPADGLADEGGEESAGDPQHRGQEETLRIVWARREQARDQASDEADHDDPDDVRHPNLPRLYLSLPPTSSVATLAGRRATVVQTPTANPIVAAVPRGVVTTHCRSWGLAHSRCEARWLLYDRRLLDRAWRDSLPPATSDDTEYR